MRRTSLRSKVKSKGGLRGSTVPPEAHIADSGGCSGGKRPLRGGLAERRAGGVASKAAAYEAMHG
ncbi:MAG: hypothetical protein LBU32_19925 [Clostridiales bacterium]|nr:hypothetical protein [Clostridiales bacterium]